MDFLLMLNYPNGLNSEECTQAAYVRGYKETKQTSFSNIHSEEGPTKTVRERIRSHIEDNYEVLQSRDKKYMQHYEVETLEELIEIEKEVGDETFFNVEDGKAYFVPGKSQEIIKAWDSGMMFSLVYDGVRENALVEDEEPMHYEFPSYEELVQDEPNGWHNHNEQVLLFYLQKFPGTSSYGIFEALEGSHSTSTTEEWPEEFIGYLKELKAPIE